MRKPRLAAAHRVTLATAATVNREGGAGRGKGDPSAMRGPQPLDVRTSVTQEHSQFSETMQGTGQVPILL